MTVEPWSARLAPERLDALRLLVAVHPAASELHLTAQAAHYMLARTLADITDLDEASITAIVATLRSLWDDADNGSEQTLPLALERTLQAPLNGAYIHAMLAGAVLRSHETLTRMQEADSAATGFTPAQVEAQRRDAAMTIRAFCAWERATGFAPPAETGRQNGDGPWRSGENDGQS